LVTLFLLNYKIILIIAKCEYTKNTRFSLMFGSENCNMYNKNDQNTQIEYIKFIPPPLWKFLPPVWLDPSPPTTLFTLPPTRTSCYMYNGHPQYLWILPQWSTWCNRRRYGRKIGATAAPPCDVLSSSDSSAPRGAAPTQKIHASAAQRASVRAAPRGEV